MASKRKTKSNKTNVKNGSPKKPAHKGRQSAVITTSNSQNGRKKRRGGHAKAMSASIDPGSFKPGKQSKAMQFMNAQTPTLNIMSNKRVAFARGAQNKTSNVHSNGVHPLKKRGRSRSAADTLKRPPKKVTYDDMKVNEPKTANQRARGRPKARGVSNKFMVKRPKSVGKDNKKGMHAQVFSDDDLDLNEMRLMVEKSGKSGKRNSIKPLAVKKQNLTKRVLHKCNNDLDKSYQDDKKDILYCFKLFKQAINDQEVNLLSQLEKVYHNKKRFLTQKDHDLETAQKRKNRRPMTISFNPNISLVLDKAEALKQIQGFGYVDFYDDEEGNGKDNKRLIKSKKQKNVLTKLQNETMSKLNAIIRMEEELRKKKSDAVKLRAEVEDDLLYIEQQKEIVNQRLKAAQPEIDAARAAVADMDPKELHEIRSLKSPPAIIELAMTATCLVLGVKVKTWRDVQKRLDYKFVRDILEYDGRNMPRENRIRVERDFIAKDDFNYERVDYGSKVSGCMVLWVNSQVRYSKLLDDVVLMEEETVRLGKDAKHKLKLAALYERITKELEVSIGKYEVECQQMIANIISKTSKELKSHESSLNPVNAKFFDMLNIC
eukprot:728498_1